MLDSVKASSATRLAAIVEDVLRRRGVGGPVAEETELARLGLTSVDMVEIMFGVEAEFDIAIPPNDVTLDNFGSVAAMSRLVARLAPDA